MIKNPLARDLDSSFIHVTLWILRLCTLNLLLLKTEKPQKEEKAFLLP